MTSVSEDALDQVRKAFGRVAYTHKVHEKDAERLRQAANLLKLANVIVVGIGATTAIIAPLLEQGWAAWAAAASAVTALAFAVYQLSFDPVGDAHRHSIAAKSYLALRNQYETLLVDAPGLDSVTFGARRDHLILAHDQLDRTAPPTTARAYRKAREALRGSESLDFSDEEYFHLAVVSTEEPSRPS